MNFGKRKESREYHLQEEINQNKKNPENTGRRGAAAGSAWKYCGVLALAGMLAASSATAFAQEEGRITLRRPEDAAASEEQILETEEETEEEDTESVSEEESEIPRIELKRSDIEKNIQQETEAQEQSEPETEAQSEAESEELTETGIEAQSEAEPEELTETEEETEKAAEDSAEAAQADTLEAVETGAGAIAVTDVSELVERVWPAMVTVYGSAVSETDGLTQEDAAQEVSQSVGTGMILAQNDTELLIVTSADCVDDMTDLTVEFAADETQSAVKARLKGTAKTMDLAMLAVELTDIPEELLDSLKTVVLGDSASVKLGQATVVIGNAYGEGLHITCGVVSSLNRSWQDESIDTALLVTDAAINEGSAGGAVFNANGEVIGICIGKEGSDGAEGMTYAVPINDAVSVLENLANRETRDRLSDEERGYIGATVVNVSDDAKELYDMPAGAFVYEVTPGSAAEEAGIRKGDIITKFEGEEVTGSSDLIEKISYYAAGETVTLEVQTANAGGYEAREVEITLQEASASVSSDDTDTQK